jgi:hypothetical protein
MGLDNNVDLALANFDLNEPVLEPVTFDNGDPLDGSSSTPVDVKVGLTIEEEKEDGEECSGNGADFYDSGMEEGPLTIMSYEILPSTILLSTIFCICHWHSHL